MLAGALSLQSQCAQIEPVARHRRTPEIASGYRHGELEKRVSDAVVAPTILLSCASKASNDFPNATKLSPLKHCPAVYAPKSPVPLCLKKVRLWLRWCPNSLKLTAVGCGAQISSIPLCRCHAREPWRIFRVITPGISTRDR
jgi:hypothetical protein